jgi:hypothetical protein
METDTKQLGSLCTLACTLYRGLSSAIRMLQVYMLTLDHSEDEG